DSNISNTPYRHTCSTGSSQTIKIRKLKVTACQWATEKTQCHIGRATRASPATNPRVSRVLYQVLNRLARSHPTRLLEVWGGGSTGAGDLVSIVISSSEPNVGSACSTPRRSAGSYSDT